MARLSFPEIAHRFYCRDHPRRWLLLLKMRSRNPTERQQHIRVLFGVARPFDPEAVAL